MNCTLTSPAMNCPNPLGNVIVAMMKTTTAGYIKRLQTGMTQVMIFTKKVSILTLWVARFKILSDQLVTS